MQESEYVWFSGIFDGFQEIAELVKIRITRKLTTGHSHGFSRCLAGRGGNQAGRPDSPLFFAGLATGSARRTESYSKGFFP